MVYFAHIYSQISFFWVGSSSSMTNVFIIQKAAIRIMLRLGPSTSCREGFKKQDILTLPCLYVFALILFVVKNLNIHQTNSSVPGMNTRQQNKLRIPSVRLSSIHRDVYYLSVKIFSQLPQNILKSSNNVQSTDRLHTALAGSYMCDSTPHIQVCYIDSYLQSVAPAQEINQL